jgi:FMN reductase (NADPH)
MNTPTIELIYRHYSVRSYRDEPLPAELVEQVVAAGQRASTSSNLQTYSVVAVTDAAKRGRLAQLSNHQVQIVQAPVFMAWCADFSRLERVGRRRGHRFEAGYVENFLVAAMDAAIASQTAALAAESLGLGTCYIGAIRNHPAQVIELLELPHLVFPVTGMTLGWPAARPTIRPRLGLNVILHWERYDTEGEEEALAAYDQAMIDTGIYDGRQVPVPGVAGETEGYGWQEHSARRLSQPQRTHLREVLYRQGFELK